ncbi:MAG: hypothetical protein O7E52_09115, partial [Candidatus Poribacteria bacterium]|nr:hypothetical protein [Candidatus Poribacteria bacterium]
MHRQPSVKPFIQLDLLVQSIQEHVNPQLDVANPAVVIEKSVEVLEDLALLGLMARGVDHEANNDLNDVLYRLERIRKKLPTDSPVTGEVKHILADLQNIVACLQLVRQCTRVGAHDCKGG